MEQGPENRLVLPVEVGLSLEVREALEERRHFSRRDCYAQYERSSVRY
jgi:hypothetical protein